MPLTFMRAAASGHRPNPLLDTGVSRRFFLAGLGSVLAVSARAADAPSTIKAIAFDAFPIFDPRSLTAIARSLVGERGEAMAAQWSAKLFGYTWLETAADHYESFRTIADKSLRATAETMGIALDDATRQKLVAHYDELDVWPDAKPTLDELRAHGIRLAFLSNLSFATLQANIVRNGLADYFEPPLSTDAVRHFKPSPVAYAMAIDAFRLPKAQVGFVAFGAWDAIGAAWFGYRTAWINRLNVALDPLDQGPEVTTQGLDGALMLAGVA